MKEEKVFDNRLASLVNEASLSGEWPKEELWRAIEKRGQKKKRAWHYYAAVVLLFLSFSGYLMSLGEKGTSQIMEGEDLEKLVILVGPQPGDTIEKEILDKEIPKYVKTLAPKVQLVTTIPQSESLERTLPQVEVANNPVQSDRKAWTIEPIQNIKVSSLVLPVRSGEIALVQADEAKSIYLYIPEKGEKKRYSKVGRLLNQIGRFNTDGDFDWEEVNVKPQLIWAYLKESTKSQEKE
ncbi:MAG: hypothetical protein ACI9DJ_000598 [Algoriphagus sp.]|jgi:hypothetical protein